MSSKKKSKSITITNSLLKTKNKHTKNKHTKNKHTKTNKLKRPHNIDKYCKYYKTDINGKTNKKLYNSCKINKYCRKQKCQDIDSKLLKAKQTNIGNDYNKIIFDKIKSSCSENISEEDVLKNSKTQKKCVSKAIKQIYKDNNLTDIYKKSLECDNVTCAKEQKIFNINLFRQKKIHLNKSKIKLINNNNNFKNEVDHDLIVRGDL